MIAILRGTEEIELSESYAYKDFIKSEFQCNKWNKENKVWTIPFSIDNVNKLQTTNCTISDEIIQKYEKEYLKLKLVTEEKMLESSVAMEPMPIKAKPYTHQIKAFNIACRILNLFEKEK